jgi:hypothetical protein
MRLHGCNDRTNASRSGRAHGNSATRAALMRPKHRAVALIAAFGGVLACSATTPLDPTPATTSDDDAAATTDDGVGEAGTARDSSVHALDTTNRALARRDGSAGDASAIDDATCDETVCDGSSGDGAPISEASNVNAGPPALRFVGRFDTSDPAGPRMGWPGTKVLARFDGTSASVTLSQFDGFSGGPSYFNVVVDGAVAAAPLIVTGFGATYVLAQNLAPGTHSLELEKRTEANLGVVRFEGFTFAGGTGLLSPPPSRAHVIELMSNSAIDGYGILGDRTVCGATDPPATNDSRQSFSFATAEGIGADMMLSAYSGKGLLVNEDPTDTDYYPIIWPRTLPEQSWSTWGFSPPADAVVMALGGVDMEGLGVAPPGFEAAYDAFVGTVRSHYPDAFIWLLLWSQIKEGAVGERSAYDGVISDIVSKRNAAGDGRIFVYVLPESSTADDSGCEGHANAAHEKAMAALMVTEIRARTGW